MKEYRVENGRLLLIDTEALTKTTAAPGFYDREFPKFFVGTTCEKPKEDDNMIAIKTKSNQLVVMVDVKYLYHWNDIGIIYQRGDDYRLWLFDDEVEKPLGSWQENGSFFLRREGDKKIVFCSYAKTEFEFLSYINAVPVLAFEVEKNCYRIFRKDYGREISVHFIHFSLPNTWERNDLYLHRQQNGTYRPIVTVEKPYRSFTNGYIINEDQNLTLFGFDDGNVKRLHSAPKDLWDVNLDAITCGNLRWKLDNFYLVNLEPEVLDNASEDSAEAEKPKKPWWKLWKK